MLFVQIKEYQTETKTISLAIFVNILIVLLFDSDELTQELLLTI
jgi:hypothetical protein